MKTKKLNVLLSGLFFMSFFFASHIVSAQSDNVIIEKGILVKTTYKQDVEGGDKKRRLDKVETYNEKGQLVDLKNYDSSGKNAKDWFQYKYDNKGNLIETIEYDSRQKLKERTVYKYANGLKISKEVFDEKDRLSKHTTYEFQFKK